jgi:hypothetical protein
VSSIGARRHTEGKSAGPTSEPRAGTEAAGDPARELPAAATVLDLQRSAGNAAVARMLAAPAAGRVLARRRAGGPARERREQRVEGVIWSEDGWNLRRGRSAKSAKVAHLRHGARIFVVDRHSGDGSWSKVTTPRGLEGYVAENVVKTDLPCPGARIHVVRSGETALGIAGRFFGDAQTDGMDGRFYVNVLQYVNDKRQTDSWKDVHFDAGRSIWIPSVQFAKSLKGRVKSGSITGGLWAKTKRAVNKALDIVVGVPAFVFGVLEGVASELADIVVGTVQGVVSIVKSLVRGSILSDAKELWDAITHINPKQVLGDLWRNWVGKGKNPWDRWAYRGELVGRALALAVLTFFSGGGALAARAGSQLARLAGKLKSLSIVKRVRGRVGGRQRAKVERMAREQDLARDPDRGGAISEGSLREARDALELEAKGVMAKPVRRANGKKHPRENGADFVDADGQLWDHKIATSEHGFDAKAYVRKVKLRDISNGEKIILNQQRLNRADRRALRREIREQGVQSEFRFV